MSPPDFPAVGHVVVAQRASTRFSRVGWGESKEGKDGAEARFCLSVTRILANDPGFHRRGYFNERTIQ